MNKLLLSISAAALLLGMVACNATIDITDASPESGLWSVSIPATKGGETTKALAYDEVGNKISTSFNTTDKVFVYNKTKGALDANYLSPETNGSSVTISGTLAGNYEVGDELTLRYGSDEWFDGHFDYEDQTGTFETVRDFATATVSVTAVDAVNHKLTLGNAHFTNPYSIYRFTLVNGETADPLHGLTGDPISFNSFFINPYGKFVCWEDADGSARYYYGDGKNETVTRETWRDAPSTDPVWLALSHTGEAGAIEFTAIDEANQTVYMCGSYFTQGLQNGKFYAPTLQMWPCMKPTITDNASGNQVDVTKLGTLFYDDCYYTYENPGSDISISGFGDETCIKWNWQTNTGDVTVRLADGAGFKNIQKSPIQQAGGWGRLIIELNGNCDCATTEDHAAILIYKGIGEVVFQGSGTLLVNASSTIGTKGISCCDANGLPKADVPNVHAADGYTLTIEDGGAGWFEGGDHCWAYKVAPQ